VLAIITAEKSVFDHRDVARVVNRYTEGAGQFQSVYGQVMASPELVRLTQETRDPGGRAQAPALYSTRDMIAVEARMDACAARLAGGGGYGVSASNRAATLDAAIAPLRAFDRDQLVLPLVEASLVQTQGTLGGAGDRSQQLTRVLRDALHAVLLRLQAGQVLLATVGSTAPFVGLLGTVWGIYHALVGIAGAGQVSIDKISGPVGEALIMTAAGLAVAIPAVLGYNILGRVIARIEADLEGFARDLRELLLSRP
jgi:biopolymer transport protein ExbB